MKRLLIIFSLFLLSACAGTLRPEPAPSSVVEAQLHERAQAPQSLRMQAKVDYFDDTRRERVVGRDFVISAQAPAKLRVTLSSFDKALSTLVTDGSQFWLIDTMQNVFAQGSASAENISQILPLYLSALDLFAVLTGDFPHSELVDNWQETQSFSWDAKANAYVLTQDKKSGEKQRVYYDYPDLNIVAIEFVRDDAVRYRYEAKEFAKARARAYPQKISFFIPDKKIELRLRVEKYDENIEFKPQVFQLKAPDGVRQIIMP